MADTPILGPKGRSSFPELYKATSMEEGKTPKFSLTLVYEPENMEGEQLEKLKALKAAAEAASQERFGCGLGEKPKTGGMNVRTPFLKGEDKTQWYEDGQIIVRFSSVKQPNVVDEARQAIGERDTPGFYAGCWAHCTWTVYAYDHKLNRGVAFGLRNVQKTGDDEPFGAPSTSADDDFEVLAEPATADDIPF